MATKASKEFLNDARNEHRHNGNTSNSSPQGENINANTENQNTGANTENNNTGANTQDQNANTNTQNQNNGSSSQNQNSFSNNSQPHAETSSFQDQFNEYFKGQESLIAGGAITEMIDDIKKNLLFIYARKQGLNDVTSEMFTMDPKSKKFCSFLIDYAIKNKLFSFIEKYPLVGAGGVVAISGLTSYLFIQAMKGSKDQAEEFKRKAEESARENEILKTELEKFKKAQDATILSETKNNTGNNTENNTGDVESGNIVNDTIRKL